MSGTTRKLAVILSGSGVYDGSELHEAVITLLSIDKLGACYQCFAPDMDQHHVINHLTGEEMAEKRNVLVEAARIARGDIKPVRELKAADYDAVILPGGFGAAKNLSDFAFRGSELRVQIGVSNAVKDFRDAGKPVGMMCIAPAMAGRLFNEEIKATIGTDPETAAVLEATGVNHINCEVRDIVVDEQNKLVTTPAYMTAQSISEAAVGIEKLVSKVIEMA